MGDSLLKGLNKEGSIEDLNLAWGNRSPQRYTYGLPARTHFIEAVKALDLELRELQAQRQAESEARFTAGNPDMHPVPELIIPGLQQLVDSLCHSWAGELGRDTTEYIRGVGAAKGQANIMQLPPQQETQ